MTTDPSASDLTEVAPQLHHIILVGGTVREWAAMSDQQWSVRLSEMGKVADHCGARWLSLRPFSGDDLDGRSIGARSVVVGNCHVEARPEADGRARIAAAVLALHDAGSEIDERHLGAALNAPSDVDPDLVVVLGRPDRLPMSLVWELAYSELVFAPVSWGHLGANHLDEAIASYSHRHRRFGGVD